MKLERKIKTKGGISTASMPDIIFMLLIFFMMSTVLREYEGLNVILPSAKKIEKLETKKHVSYIWISRDGAISIDDRLIPTNKVREVMYAKRSENPQIVVSLRADRNVDMGIISAIHNELRKADALKVNYSATTAIN
ncbi:MAG TPA: biopolymer transporter ExbD [Candidatus Marinimicrobia bacterium]|nr:biopolymer transporter ExbD [Candidatus Neomarinimicrobiota bacterium]